jgi:hypothetical protein
VRRLTAGHRSEFLRGAMLALALLTVLGGWLLAAPPGASPDDGYHLGSIWCAEGFKDDLCLEDPGAPDLSRVLIPSDVMGLVCFQYDGRRSAQCVLESFAPGMQQFIPVTGTNIRGERPNLYYRAMHRLIMDDLATSTARMRVANLMVMSLMVLGTSLVAERRMRSAYVLSTLAASVPLGLFLATSLNTSAWGLAGLTTLWANLYTAVHHERRLNRSAGAALAVLGIALGFGSRTEAIAHIGVSGAVIAAMWFWARLDRSDQHASRGSDLRTLAAGLAATTGAIALTVLAPQNAGIDRIVRDISSGYERLTARGIGDPFLAIAFEVPSLWTGALGHIWGLGALDTPIPTLATVPLIGAFVALLVLGLQGAVRPRRAAASIAAAALFALPTLSLLRSGLIVYEELQPRQFMVLLYVLLGVSLLRLRGEEPLTLGRGMRAMLTLGLSLGHSVALLVTMRRHVSGLVEFRYVSFSSDIEWWWPSGPTPNTVWATASVAFVVAAIIALSAFSARPSVPGDPTPPARIDGRPS